MANTPTPRSYTQILGGMISAFLAKFPIRNLKVGGPILSVLEAAAQSDLRNTSETFTLLASTSLDSAEGTALDRIMADENTARIGAAPSTGTIIVTDTRYTKKATTLYQGKPAPLAGTATLYVSDASTWPASGALYIGRGTLNYEGPLQYTSITPPGLGDSFYTINLNVSYRTTRYHNLGESVVLAQGGDRIIPAGAIVQTPQGNTATAVQFSVLYQAVLPDGEVSVAGVQIICTQPGTIGNVVAGSISEFTTPPFTGAICENPLALINGIEVETDSEARARVRNLRQSRTRGTDLAIETYLLGVTSVDENKRIASVKVVDREGYPTTAYIDDGTGYEEVPSGIAYEVLTHSAIGGEEYFQLAQGRPVTKAFLASFAAEPYNIAPNSHLTVLVGGVQSQHTFVASDFRNPSSAAAYEVVQSINANPNLTFSARTHENGTKVIIFAKADTNEDLQIVSTGTNANTVLQFPLGQVFSCRLYKNDVLLSKDGLAASLVSNSWSNWSPVSDGATLITNVDGTGDVTHTFNDIDFVLAGTGYNTVSNGNSLASWATVLNYKIPGITAVVEGDHLRVTSNAGAVARGSLSITGGTLVSSAVFFADSSTARVKDFTLNRNTGQLHLSTPLSTNDKLTAGTMYTRGFDESVEVASTLNIATGGNLYWLFDAAAEFIPLPLTGSLTFTVTQAAFGSVELTVFSCDNGTPFTNVLPGDLVMFWDSAILTGSKTPLRAIQVTDSAIIVAVPTGTTVPQASFSLTSGGITVVRTNGFPYKVNLPSGAFYTANSLASTTLLGLSASNDGWSSGGSAEVIRNGFARVRTNTYGPNGDVALIGVDNATIRDIWTEGTTFPSGVNHLAYVESGNPENSTPIFAFLKAPSASTDTNTIRVQNAASTYMTKIDASVMVSALRSMNHISEGLDPLYGNNIGYVSSLSAITVPGAYTAYAVRKPLLNKPLQYEHYYVSRPYAIGAGDDLSVVFDNDVSSKRFDVSMARRVSLAGSTYANTNVSITDYDNVMFGPSSSLQFPFEDFALVMHPRVITGLGADEILWRWKTLGANNVGFAWDYPSEPDAPVGWTTDYTSEGVSRLSITIPSGAARTLTNLTTTAKIGVTCTNNALPLPQRFYLILGYAISTMSSDGTTVTATVTAPQFSGMTNCGLTAGQQVYVKVDPGIAWLTSGVYTVAGSTGMNFTFNTNTGGPQGPSAGATSTVTTDTSPDTAWTNVQLSDIMVISNVFGATVEVCSQPLVVDLLDGTNGKYIRVTGKTGVAGGQTTPIFSGAIADVANIQDFTVGDTAGNIVAALPADAPVTAVLRGNGTGVINTASWFTYSDLYYSRPFVDGINYVKTTTITPNGGGFDYSIDFKNVIDATLTGYTQWTSEEAYLCPMTATNIASYLNVLAVCGISANGLALTSSSGSKVQINTSTMGTAGSVQVRGGLANSALADVKGGAGETADLAASYVTVPTTQTTGFHVEWPVRITNSMPYVKVNGVSTANLVSIVGNTWTFSASLATSQRDLNLPFRIERQGNLVAYQWEDVAGAPNWSTFTAGDFVTFSNQVGDDASANNLGTFVIHALDNTNHVFFVENANATDEQAQLSVSVVTRDSIVPGDTLVVSTPNWGVGNQRSFTVASVNYVWGGSTVSFTTGEAPVASGAVAGPQTGVQLRSGILHSFTKTINSIVPRSDDPSYSVITFVEDSSQTNAAAIGEAYGSQLRALNKLEFEVGTAIGNDGYSHSVGLIGEADKVMYGYETDPVTYPGVVAAGANVNISGPLVKRIQIALSLRVRGTTSVIFEAVRGAVATFVNSSKVGESIAISDIVSIAASIGGVEAVSVASPTYSTTNDRIAVQPYEKPLVLQPEVDITLTLIG